MGLDHRVRALEEAEVERIKSQMRRCGGTMSEDELNRATEGYLQARRTCPPSIDAGNELVDIEPMLRHVAACMGLDPDAAVAEAERLLAERGHDA